MSELRTNIRVTAEGLGIISKPVVTFLVLLYDARTGAQGSLALLAFAGGQLAYGTMVLGTYMVYYHPHRIWPKRLPPNPQHPCACSLKNTSVFSDPVLHQGQTEGVL